MAVCECGCGAELSGKQKRFKNGRCRMNWWSEIRRNAALGRGLGALLPQETVLKPAGKMHRRNAATNPRLQRLLAFLRDGPKTNVEIGGHMKSTSASTIVSDLRQNGFDIRGRYLRMTKDRHKIYLYTLVESDKAAA